MNAYPPSAKTIQRVTDAYLSQDARKLYQFEYRGYTVRIYESPYTPGEMLVCADKMQGNNRAIALSHEVTALDAARLWLRSLP